MYGFAHPRTGRTFCAILPRVSAERMGDALAAFAAHADPDGTKVLVLVVDNAGWHRARRLAIPANVRLRYLPRGFVVGAVITGATALAVLGTNGATAATAWRRRRDRGEVPPDL